MSRIRGDVKFFLVARDPWLVKAATILEWAMVKSHGGPPYPGGPYYAYGQGPCIFVIPDERYSLYRLYAIS